MGRLGFACVACALAGAQAGTLSLKYPPAIEFDSGITQARLVATCDSVAPVVFAMSPREVAYTPIGDEHGWSIDTVMVTLGNVARSCFSSISSLRTP